MAGFHAPRVTVEKAEELMTVGKNNTPLVKLVLSEDNRKKKDGEWVTVSTDIYEANVWGDRALEAASIEEGDVLDLAAYTNDEGKIRHKAIIQQRTWEYKGKEYSKLELVLFEWEVVDG